VIWSWEVLMTRRKVRDAREARECLQAVERCGLPRAEWARRNGVDGRSLNAWRLNLERGWDEPAGLQLVELVATPEAGRRALYTVRVGELQIEVDDQFDDDVLRRLIRVVASC